MEKQNEDKSNTFLDFFDFELPETKDFQAKLVIPYFKAIYHDLAERSKEDGIAKIDFLEYSLLPGQLGERFFAVMNKSKAKNVSMNEFLVVLFRLYCSDVESHFQLAFDMYDFDGDGKINKEDVHILMSYVPIESKNKDSIEYTDRLKAQEDISELIDHLFEGKEFVSLKEFKAHNQEHASDTFLCIISTLKSILPCTNNFYRHLAKFIEKRPCDLQGSTSSVSSSPISHQSPIAQPRSLAFKPTKTVLESGKKQSFIDKALAIRGHSTKNVPSEGLEKQKQK